MELTNSWLKSSTTNFAKKYQYLFDASIPVGYWIHVTKPLYNLEWSSLDPQNSFQEQRQTVVLVHFEVQVGHCAASAVIPIRHFDFDILVTPAFDNDPFDGHRLWSKEEANIPTYLHASILFRIECGSELLLYPKPVNAG